MQELQHRSLNLHQGDFLAPDVEEAGQFVADLLDGAALGRNYVLQFLQPHTGHRWGCHSTRHKGKLSDSSDRVKVRK
jgi:hypothetical protein